MKKIFKFFVVAFAGLSIASCDNAFDVTSPSVVDETFVFSDFSTGKTVILGAYNQYIQANTNSEGFFCNIDNIGSDIERCSVGLIADLVGASQLYGGPESYTIEKFNINFIKGIWARMYSIISKCNVIISNIENFENYDEIVKGAPNDWSDLLGQAYALRATMYYDLARYFGDVFYYTEETLGLTLTELSSRDFIIENEIEALKAIEPLMYAMGENNHFSDQMTQNYVRGLIGRLCFMEAGYATRRTDMGADFYKDKDGKTISFDVWGTDSDRNAAYGRRTDWKKFYDMALPYLEKAVNNPAGVKFTTVDPRSDKEGRSYGNPFQYYFDQVTKLVMAEETVYEVSMKQDANLSRIAYNYGRGSNGGSTAYPPKANAQTCTYPEVYYNLFDPQDMRRDVSMTVTGSTGNGLEIMNNFALSNKITGGICMNKYDVNRQDNPDARQLRSGINFVVMRQADVILMLAEAYAQTGATAKAEAELKKVHNRAFADNIENAKYAELLTANGGDVLEAIYHERKLELVGEGLRRWDLIRTGKLPQVAVEYRAKLVKDMQDLEANGYVQYPNGNQFPQYVWTKMVDAKKEYGYRLTMQTPAGKENDPVLYPGWRGQHDDWVSVAVEDGKAENTIMQGETNVAIKGLFKYIAPGSAEAKALEAEGYKQTEWGKNILASPARIAQWGSEFMIGYSDADYAAKKAPIYLIPMEEVVCTTSGLKNGYGFKSGSN